MASVTASLMSTLSIFSCWCIIETNFNPFLCIPSCSTVTQSLCAKSFPSKSARLFKQLSFNFHVDYILFVLEQDSPSFLTAFLPVLQVHNQLLISSFASLLFCVLVCIRDAHLRLRWCLMEHVGRLWPPVAS